MRDGMQLLRRLAAVCAAALSLCARAESAAVEGVPKDRPLKVLMIGNSFSLSNFRQMPKVAAAMGRRLDLASIHIGGCSLERHWNNVLAASTNATFRPYKLDRDVEGRHTARDVMVNMSDALVLDKWDVVTIQQASSLSWRSETYQPFGDLLVAKIREFAPQAKIVVQETWSYPSWDKRLANFGFGPEEMYRRLHDAYGAFAKKHGFDVVPVGAAAERFPNRESLFTKPDFHFNRDGEYLQGLVFTAKLFGADVRKCAYKPDWMDASRAEEMKSIAMAAIEGQRRFMPVDFKFSCDKPGGVYSIGEKALITVEAIETNGAPAENGVVKWKLNNFGDEEFSSGRFDLSCGTNAFTVAGAMSEPGFMRLDVCFERAEGTHGATKYFGVAYNPYEIKPGAECPADFNEFWREAVRKFDEAVTAPIKMTKVTDNPPVDRDLYELEIPTIGGRSIWGYLSEPKDLSKGPFPVIVHVPGAGPSEWGVWGDDKRICVLLNVNDYRPERRADGKLGRSPRNLELHEVQNGEWSARYPVKNKYYHQTGIASSREDYFYYGVLLAMNRAVDWIAARPEVDRTRFRYNGTSQGGGFGLWLCGLNSNFTRATVYVPALTDLLGFRCGGRESGWPRLVEGQLDENRAAAEANAPYFCGVNFARNIKIPIRVNVGSADTVCPPMAGFSAFNVMPSKDKEIIIGLGQGHAVFKDIRSRLDKWLADDFQSSQTNKHRRAEVVAFPDAPFEMPAIAVPQFAERDFSIADFGAKIGAKATDAFMAAMAACEKAGGGRVVVPEGKWLTGAVHFRNNCNLHLAEGATLEFTDDPADYPETFTSWEGVECYNYSPLLYGYGVTNVAITGKGTIAPRMDFWRTWFTRPPEHIKATEHLYHWCSTNAPVEARRLLALDRAHMRPHLIQFNRCANVLLDGFKIRESPFWTVHLYHSENCVVRNLDIYAHGHNNDGVDIEMTRNVLVENCRSDQGDDGIAVKAGRNQDAWRLNRPTENVVVRNCEFVSHNLLAVGSELSGGIRNVWLHHCKMSTPYNLLKVKTNRRRGGFVKNIWFEDVEADNVRDAVVGVKTDAIFQWAQFPDYELRTTEIDGIHVRNVRANCAGCAIDICGDVSSPVKNVVLENVWVGASRKAFERIENVADIRKDNVRQGGLVPKPWVEPYDEVWHRKPAARVREPNYDEAKVAPYTLEDPLAFADGRKLKDASEWPSRRKEILEIFAREMFGVEPPAPEVVVTELREEGPTLAGLAIRRQYRMWFRPDKSGPFIDWLLVLPNRITGEKAKTVDGRIVCENRGKVPVVLMLNFPGNHAVLDDEEVPLTEGGWFRADGDSGDHGPKESNRGVLRRSQLRTTVPAEFIVARGYAFLTACYAQVSPDVEVRKGDPEELAYTHIFELWGKRDESRTDNTTALGAWAWALSRGLDLAETIPEIDAKRCVATGSSRLGKAALLASARDERFAVCVPNQTGGGGVPLAKRDFGENVSTEMASFPHWYCKAYAKYIGNEQAMKFDQHLLVAAIAPRALLVEGFNQGWFDAKGEWLSCRAASPVWEFLGKEGLPKGDFPDNYDRSRIGSTFGYVRRGGQHGLSGYDWLWMLDFADKAFSEE